MNEQEVIDRNEARQRKQVLKRQIAAETDTRTLGRLRAELEECERVLGYPSELAMPAPNTHDAIIEALTRVPMPEKLTPSQDGMLPPQPRRGPWCDALTDEQKSMLHFVVEALGPGVNGALEMRVALPLHQWYALVGAPRKTGDEYIDAQYVDGAVLGWIAARLHRGLGIAEETSRRPYDAEQVRAGRKDWVGARFMAPTGGK